MSANAVPTASLGMSDTRRVLGGPMGQRAVEANRKSIFGRGGGHYNIYESADVQGLPMLREIFPDGEADTMNFALFSTSGIHGSYTTIEQVEASLTAYPDGINEDDDDVPEDYCGDEVTFMIVQPRLVSLTYGNATVTLADIPYLKKLRASSIAAVAKIGAQET